MKHLSFDFFSFCFRTVAVYERVSSAAERGNGHARIYTRNSFHWKVARAGIYVLSVLLLRMKYLYKKIVTAKKKKKIKKASLLLVLD